MFFFQAWRQFFSFFRRFLRAPLWSFKKSSPQLSGDPRIIPRSEHHMSRRHIPEYVLKVLYRLHHKGYAAFVVGGCVRDVLLGKEPKDFDVATDARPEQIRALFRNSRIIGRRFKLVHVMFGSHMVEVATFRGHHEGVLEAHQSRLADTGFLLRDNVYGSLEEDAFRRDVTVNALYYNIADFSIVDYTGGWEDVVAKRLRVIGDPMLRYREDPVRMLRVLRFSAKCGMQIEASSEQAMRALSFLIKDVSSARLFDELLKLFHSGAFAQIFQALSSQGFVRLLWPELAAVLEGPSASWISVVLHAVFQDTDQRIDAGKTVHPAFVLGALLWYPMLSRFSAWKSGSSFETMLEDALFYFFHRAEALVRVPRRIQEQIEAMWRLEWHLQYQLRRAPVLIKEPPFRAALDFLRLRAEQEEACRPVYAFWQAYVGATAQERETLMRQAQRSLAPYWGRRGRESAPGESVHQIEE